MKSIVKMNIKKVEWNSMMLDYMKEKKKMH